MPRLAVVSDSHLSAANPRADRNWEAILRHLEATRPDLVIHGGDISADGNNSADDLAYARAKLDRIPVRWLAVPGNHDLGGPETDPALIEERRLRYEPIFGHRFWAEDLGGWRFVGLDSEHLASESPDVERWWTWTAEQLAGDRPIVLTLHRPLAPIAPDETQVERRFLLEPHRSRLLALIAGSPVRVVLSGHAHQWRNERVDGVRWIWAPSTWAFVEQQHHPAMARKVVGLVEFDLDHLDRLDDVRLVVPDGVEQHSHRSQRRPAAVAAPGGHTG